MLFPSKTLDRAICMGAACTLLALVFFVPHQLEGQTSIRLLPQIGAYTPASDLGEVRENGETRFSAGRRSSSLAWGLGLEAGPRDSGTSIRGHMGYGTNAEIPVWGFECGNCSARSTLLTGSVTAVLRPVPRLVLVQPYLLVGAGVKRYDFDVRNADGDAWRRVFRDQTRAAAQAGVGLEASLLGLRTQWELNGHVSRYRAGSDQDASLQTDLFLTLSIPLGG